MNAGELRSKMTCSSIRLRDALAHRRVKAVGHLLSGTAATLVLTLLSIALVARLLTPATYGIFAMILTLGQACERLLGFQSWQPLIRSGATIDLQNDQASYFALLKFGWLLDIGGSVAAWAIASGLTIAGHFLFGISTQHVGYALLFLTSLLFNFNGVATAIYRLSGQYRTIARVQVANAAVRLLCVALAYLAGAGLFQLILVWTITQISGSLANFICAMRLLPAPGFRQLLRASAKGINTRFPDLWRFALGSNVSLTLWSSAQQVDTLIVGWLADPASAGLFHIAKRISRVVQQVGAQVEAVVYPDLSRLAAAGKRRAFVRVLVQTELLLAAFGACCFLAMLLVGGPLMRLAVGPHFAGAVPLLTIQILAVTLTISGAASRAGLLALGDQRAVLRTVMACTLAFYCAVFPLIPMIGAMGANIAHLLFAAIWLSGLALHLRRAIRNAPWTVKEEG
ncbi:MAG TPA: lipopolysaccharide biosynthesis protein [Sphingobium sp.]|nr:lipopolysaccharide biosynthesis protein [Sphingobium sp.]